MLEFAIVLGCVACILYLIMTTILEAWASWGRDEIAADRQPPDDGERLPPAESLHTFVSVRDAFRCVLRRYGDVEARR